MSTKLHIISGFLGAGKTTFIRNVIPFMKGKIALIENEYSDVSIDSELFIKEELVIKEIFSGCICCSLIKDFRTTIDELTSNYDLEHIFIEPSGVGCLSDIVAVCEDISKTSSKTIEIQSVVTLVDASSFEDYIDSFGEFYINQIENAKAIIITHIEDVNESALEKITDEIKAVNNSAVIFSEDYLSYPTQKTLDILETAYNHELNVAGSGKTIPATSYFTTVSIHNPNKLSMEELSNLSNIFKNREWGTVLRAKGVIQLVDSSFVHFDFTPNYFDWEYLNTSKDTKISVIGKDLNQAYIKGLFSNVLEALI